MGASVKSILLILFLYEGLVWSGLSYYYAGREDFREHVVSKGLLFTIVGLAVLLAFAVGSWLFGYWKVVRARAEVKPKPKPGPTPGPAPAGHEDTLALKTLLNEASAKLLASPSFANFPSGEVSVFSGMPLYLVIGAEGSGKTSAIANSGLNAEFLAGQPRLEKASASSTAQANIWLADNALFVEIAGRHFAADSRRWAELLAVLSSKPKVSLWRRLVKGNPPGFDLRGIIHCCDLRFFLSKPGPEQIERQSSLAQERLRAIIKTFGRRVPVFTIFTRADQIPYFREFFGRFSEREAGQILGCTLHLTEDGSDSDQAAEAKRLTKAFNGLYTSVAERRVNVLFHEPTAAKKSRIFEFPREFNKLRQPLIDFLVQTFRPSPLEPTPIHRGFYFSGTREVEPMAPSLDSSRSFETTSISFQQALDATIVFRGDPAELVKGDGGDSDLNVTTVRRGGLLTRWAFIGALFPDVILRDRTLQAFQPAAAESDWRNPRTQLLTVALSIGVFLALAWTISWFQNARVIGDLKEATALPWTMRAEGGLPSLSDLQSLDALQKSVQGLADLESSSRFWNLWHGSMRFGLYSVGSDLSNRVKEKYFSRVKNSVLDVAHAELTGSLRSLGEPGDDQGPRTLSTVSDQLKVLVMTTAPGTCQAEPELVATQLTTLLRGAGIQPTDVRLAPAASQIKFYAQQLPSGSPVELTAVPEARNRALQFIRNSGSEERTYKEIVDRIKQKLGYVEFIPEKANVLSAPSEQVSRAFTRTGLEEFRLELDKPNSSASSDACLSQLIRMAAANQEPGQDPDKSAEPVASNRLSPEAKRRIENFYSRDYLRVWRDFLTSHTLTAFSRPRDAAEKLDSLSAPNSPLLGLFRFVSDNTTYAREEKQEGFLDTFKSLLDPPKDISFTMDGVHDAFQPVHEIVPTGTDKFINDKNGAYIEGLAKLGRLMSEIDRAGDNRDAQAYKQLDEAANEAEGAVKTIRKGFISTGVGRVGEQVERLLMAPIIAVRDTGLPKVTGSDVQIFSVNSKFKAFCDTFTQDVLKKYPFDGGSSRDLAIEDFQRWFAPETGVLWTRIGDFSSLVVQDRKSWKGNSPDMRPTTELLDFLNKAQQITSGFFPPDSKTARLDYTLRPHISNDTQNLNFRIDGQTLIWNSGDVIQRDVYWPGPAGSKSSLSSGDKANQIPFAVADGPWAAFRLFQLGERSLRNLTWKMTSNGEPMMVPVQVEFVYEFPGGIDVFDRNFFRTLRCPNVAAQR